MRMLVPHVRPPQEKPGGWARAVAALLHQAVTLGCRSLPGWASPVSETQEAPGALCPVAVLLPRPKYRKSSTYDHN